MIKFNERELDNIEENRVFLDSLTGPYDFFHNMKKFNQSGKQPLLLSKIFFELAAITGDKIKIILYPWDEQILVLDENGKETNSYYTFDYLEKLGVDQVTLNKLCEDKGNG